MGNTDAAGRPARPKRYQSFLIACALVTHEQVIEESGMKLAGKGVQGTPTAPTSKKQTSQRPGR